jgi:hypothetical protein
MKFRARQRWADPATGPQEEIIPTRFCGPFLKMGGKLLWWYYSTVMVMLEFISWWYGQGWVGVLRGMQRRLYNTAHMFSAGLLLSTLFSPWRRIITYPGSSVQAHVQAAVDNFVSRFVGFIVRLFVLFTALVSLVFVAIVCLIELIAWPLLPCAPLLFLVLGLLA